MGEFNRFMTKDTLVSQVDFEDPAALIERFRQRVDGWYFESIAEWPRTGHEAFVVLLAVKAVLYQAATVLFWNMEPTDGAMAALEDAEPALDEFPTGSDRTAAERFVLAITPLGTGELKMDKGTGISGTGKSWVLAEGGVVVFDPWVIRDRVREWFNAECSRMASDPDSEAARRVAEVLRGVFQPEAD